MRCDQQAVTLEFHKKGKREIRCESQQAVILVHHREQEAVSCCRWGNKEE